MFANDNKTDDGLPTILNEERKQVTAHTNLTQNASTIDCVRYSDNGKEKQESNDTSSEEKALNDDKCEKGDLQTQASKQEAQARTIAKLLLPPLLHPLQQKRRVSAVQSRVNLAREVDIQRVLKK